MADRESFLVLAVDTADDLDDFVSRDVRERMGDDIRGEVSEATLTVRFVRGTLLVTRSMVQGAEPWYEHISVVRFVRTRIWDDSEEEYEREIIFKVSDPTPYIEIHDPGGYRDAFATEGVLFGEAEIVYQDERSYPSRDSGRVEILKDGSRG